MNGDLEPIEVTPARGVSYDPQTGGSRGAHSIKVWRVRVTVDGSARTVGRYATVSEANEAVVAYRQRLAGLTIRCTLTDLPMGACYHCNRVNLPMARTSGGGTTPSTRRSERRIRPPEVIIAHRDFTLPCGDCLGPMLKGQRLRSGANWLLMHEICGEPVAPEPEFEYAQ